MKILYFARLRQIIGRGQDEVEVPADVKTVSALIDYLKGRDEGIAAAFADLRTLKVAINQSHASLDASLAGPQKLLSSLLSRAANAPQCVFAEGWRWKPTRGRAHGGRGPREDQWNYSASTTPAEEGDVITLDGKPVAPSTKPLPRLFVLNKPLDVLVTHRDHKGRRTIFDLDVNEYLGLAATDECRPSRREQRRTSSAQF